jgi:hypothetical protein
VRIASTTATNPIVVTTATPHGFNTGDSVEQEGCPDPNANSSTYASATTNGLFVISVLTPTTYELNGTTGTFAGGAVGYAVSYEVQPAFALPNAGEPASMVTLSPILQGLMNAIPFLYRLTGKRRTHMTYHGNPATAPVTLASLIPGLGSPWSTTFAVTSGTVYNMPNTLTPIAGLLNDIGNTSSTTPVFEPTDELDVEYQTSASFFTSSPDPCFIVLCVSDGANVGYFYDTAALITPGDSSPRIQVPLSLRRVVNGAHLQALGLTLPRPLFVGLAAIPSGSDASAVLEIFSPAQITVVQRRYN